MKGSGQRIAVVTEQADTIVRTTGLLNNPRPESAGSRFRTLRCQAPAPWLRLKESATEGKTVQENHPRESISRRTVLTSMAISATGLIAGCGKTAEQAQPAPERRDVPLRAVLVGRQEDADVISRAWSSVTSGSVEFDLLTISREDPAELAKLPQLAKKNDLLIYPLMAVADLYAASAIVPNTEDEFEAAEEDLGQVYPALRNGAAMYAGQLVSLPLRASLPALVTVDSIDRPATWADYDKWVSEMDGAVSEPLAPGWAAITFLRRVASVLKTGWMFTRETLTPLVDSQLYVDVLSQLKTTADRYQADRMTPPQIFNQIQQGKLRGGICFQTGESESPVNVVGLPGQEGVNRVLLDPFSSVVSISAACRQTRLSKQFVTWLSGGEGSETVRRQVHAMTTVRKSDVDPGTGGQQQGDNYQAWLSQRLEIPITLPAMQLLSAGDYYRQLDQQVTACLDGKVAPQEALQAVAAAWSRLHDQVGLQKQERAWRRAQGRRA